ncbi:MAG: disulfide bond formation protein B [Methylococcaceae bacterium]|nr:disulfide bond formation protein B [Methylococcaceae bacterium]
MLKPRVCFSIGLLGCATVLGVGVYLQFVEELEPCPLCISQRLLFLATGLVFLLGTMHGRFSRFYAALSGLTALGGASVSARHVWLQHLPPEQVPECSPGIEYVFQHFPLADTLKLMLTGTGECAKVDWAFLGLAIPAWALIAFLGLSALSVLAFRQAKLD